MADRKISQMTPAAAEDVTDQHQFVVADIAATDYDLGNRSLTVLQAKRTFAMGASALATADDLDGLQVQIDAMTSGVLIVGAWDAGTGAFPATRPGGAPIEAGDAWIVTGSGTVDGVDFEVADRLVALVDGGGAAYAGNWVRSPRVADLRHDFAGRAAFEAAVIPAEILTVNVQHLWMVLRYVRDPAGGTESGDGSRWRLIDGADYPTVAALVTDTYPYDTGDRVSAAGHLYDVVAADPDVTSAGGVLFRVMPAMDGRFYVDAFNPPDFGVDATAVIQRAISRGPIVLGPRRYQVNNIQPVGGMQIYGNDPAYLENRCGLVCTTLNGNIFYDATAAAIHNVVMEDFYWDATQKGVTFYNSTSTTKYTGTFRIKRCISSNLFALLFRCCPIYWLIDECDFGHYGARHGNTQEFRIFEAWSTATTNPINLNVVRNTKHYYCAPGATYTASYTMRSGSSWLFENSTAERFEGPIVDARGFADLRWEGGWIEWINAPSLFLHSNDAAAPQNIGGPIVLRGLRIYFGDATTQQLVSNSGGLLTVEDITATGVANQVRAGANPNQVISKGNFRGFGTRFLDGVGPRQAVFVPKFSPWGNGILPARISYSTSGGPNPTISGVVSDLSGANTSRISLGDREQAYIVQVPLALLRGLETQYAQLALVGYFETAAAGAATACYWLNTASPSWNNITAQGDAYTNISGANLGISRCPIYIPAGITSLHIGFTATGADVGKWFRIEGLHLVGDSYPEVPFFV